MSNRTQVYNAKTGKYIKRDKETGKFLSSKDTPFKNIRKEGVKKEEIDNKNEIKSSNIVTNKKQDKTLTKSKQNVKDVKKKIKKVT